MNRGQKTRLSILQQAFELSYKKGYQATSVDDIIHFTTVTKGSFFYHFKNKEEMGLAMINEVMLPGMRSSLVLPLENNGNTKAVIYDMMKSILMEDPHFDPKYGCPAVNIIEEMAPISQEFNKAITKLTDEVRLKIEELIEAGIARGEISKDASPKQIAHFVLTGYMGIRTLGKLYGPKCYNIYLKELKNYIDNL